MKLKCKLEKAVITEEEKSINIKYIFKPTQEAYKKAVTFTVSSPNPQQTMENLKLPCTIGDTIILEMISKEAQSKLEAADDKKEGTDRKTNTHGKKTG